MKTDDSTPNTTGPNPSDTQAIEQAAALEQQAETNRRAVVDKAEQALAGLNPAAPDVAALTRAVRLLLRLELDRFEETT